MVTTLQSATPNVKSSGMKYQGFVEKFKRWKEAHGLTNYKIEKLTGYSRANLTNLEKGLIGPSDDLLEKLGQLTNYGISTNELKAWRLTDEYGKDAILKAAEELRTRNPEKMKRVDKLMKEME